MLNTGLSGLLKKKRIGDFFGKKVVQKTMRNLQLIEASGYYDPAYYEGQYFPDESSKLSALEHFYTKGWQQGFSPSSRFSTQWYLNENPDVQASGINPLVHFIRYGKKEGRLPRPLNAIEVEKKLWGTANHSVSKIEQLEKLSSPQSTPESLYATWALARWYAGQGQWQTALPFARLLLKAIDNEVNSAACEDFLPHNGPYMLVFSILLECRMLSAARSLLEKQLAIPEQQADLPLLQCSLEQAEQTHQKDGLIALRKLFRSQKLLEPGCKRSKSALDLDNLIMQTPSIRTTTKLPLVSVIIPLFNAEKTLTTAVESLLCQTYNNLEILIVDDCSTDTSLAIAQSFSKQDLRVKVIQQHCNQGAYAARNTGLKAAKGLYITTHDADDWSHGQKIELQVNALIENPEYKVSVSHWARCSSNLVFGTWRQESSWVHRNVSSLMFQRSVFENLGYWDRVSVSADTEYYYRILAEYGQNSVHEVMPGVPLSFGRWSHNTLTSTSETHWRTQFCGVRKDYIDAAYRWHLLGKAAGSLYMGFNPECRMFEAPSAITRPGQYFGSSHDPVFSGSHQPGDGSPAVLLCAHAAGKALFGAERSLLDLARAISHNGYRLVVTLPQQGSQEYLTALLEFASAVIVMPYLWWHEKRPVDRNAVERFKALIQGYDIKLVHSNTLVLREPLLAAKDLKIPGLMHVRELPEQDHALCTAMGTGSESIKKYIHQWATGFIANSQCTSLYVDGEADEKQKSFLLYNMVEACQLQQPVKKSAFIRFGLISSNTPQKGLEDFVKLAKSAEGLVHNAKFVLIGPENDHIKSLLKSKDLPQNIIYSGYAKSPEEALKQVDVVLNLSSFQESFGRTIAEAMVSGRPVIGYRWGALPELIDNGVNGYLVHLGDINGLTQRVDHLASNKNLLNKLGLSGKKKALRSYSFNTFAKNLDSIYSNFLN